MDGVQDAQAVLPGVGRNEQGGLEQGGGFSLEIADGAARFGEDEAGSRVVPGHEAHLEVKLCEAGGHQAQLHGRAAAPAHVVAFHIDIIDNVAASPGQLLAVGAHGREKDPLPERTGRYVERIPVAEGALPFLGRIKFSAPGGIDDAEDRLALFHQGHADTAVLVAAGVIGRSVDGIYDPDSIVPGHVMEVLLLAEETHLRVAEFQLLCEEMLDRQVG